MREIKFRIWNELMEKMCYPTEYIKFQYYSDGIGVEVEYGEPEYPKNYAIRGNDIKLMQFTGLHDKNGKEIYEGDLVKFDPYKNSGWENCYEITYYGGGFIISAGGFTGANLRYWSDKANDIEVIGNIYENPEMASL